MYMSPRIRINVHIADIYVYESKKNVARKCRIIDPKEELGPIYTTQYISYHLIMRA